MKETYIGGIGTFLKGHRMDIPEDLLEHIPKDCYRRCRAPWDEHKDRASAKLTEAESQAQAAQSKADQLRGEAEQLIAAKEGLFKKAAATQTVSDKARAAAKQLHEKKDKSNNELKKLKGLVRTAEKTALEDMRAKGLLEVAIAEAGLKELDAQDSQAKADHLAAAAGRIKAAIANAKKKAEEKVRKKAEAEAKATAAALTSAPVETKDTNNAKPESEQSANSVDRQIDESGVKQIDGSGVKQIDGVAEG